MLVPRGWWVLGMPITCYKLRTELKAKIENYILLELSTKQKYLWAIKHILGEMRGNKSFRGRAYIIKACLAMPHGNPTLRGMTGRSIYLPASVISCALDRSYPFKVVIREIYITRGDDLRIKRCNIYYRRLYTTMLWEQLRKFVQLKATVILCVLFKTKW